ncbi:MAG: hypothetical protein WD513_01585 [Balneolaceae bacterium]
MIRTFLIIAVYMASMLFCTELSAQVSQIDTERSLLPEIDPQDIEIRSQFQARFPGLRRQPILGFNPRPRVFQTDPNRLPFIESEDVVAANLPVGSLTRPDAPVFTPLGYSMPKNAFFRGGIGSEISPEADLYAMSRLGNNNWISGNATLRSSDGHDERVTTSYRYFDASIKSYNRFSDRTDLTLSAGVHSNFNHMLQLNSEIEDLLNVDTKVASTGFNGTSSLHIANTSLSGVKLSLNGFVNKYQTQSGLSSLNGDADEWEIDFDVDYSRLGSNINEIHSLRFENKTGSIKPLFMDHNLWSVSTLSAQYERLFNYRTDVNVSFGVSGVTDAVDDFTFYISPKLEFKHRFFTGFNIRGLLSASPSHQNYSKLQMENRFFDFRSELMHQYEKKVLGEILLEPFYGTKILAGVSFQDVKNFQYYSRSENPVTGLNIEEGYYTANFSRANMLRVFGGVSQDLRPDVLWMSADGYWQLPKLSNGDRIPYAETFSIKASVSVRPVKKALLEGWGEFSGSRENHLGEKLPSYTTIGGKFEISVSERVGVYGKLLNLLNEEYELWSGYNERGFQGFVGFTVLF